jgi:hypothetical protein
VDVLDAAGFTTGTRVTIEGREPEAAPEQIDIDAFFTVPLEVVDGVVTAGGKALLLDGKPVRTGFVSKGEVH